MTLETDPPPVSSQDPAPQEVEFELRERLQGCRLVFELGLSEADFRRYRKPLFAALRDGRAVNSVRLAFPALFVTYLAGVGTFLYEGGTYWDSVHPYLKDPDADAGHQFLVACDALRLERFDDLVETEGGFKWVSRILAHGGIPVSCLKPFAELVAREVAQGAPGGPELITHWRSRGATLPTLHQPTRRFLLYGGDISVDLLDRCIELLRSSAALGDATDTGLPQYVIDAFRDLDRTTLTRATRQTAAGLAAPVLRLDPYDGLGPVIRLPPVPQDRLGGLWRVSDGGVPTRHAPSAFASTSVRVSPGRTFEVEFEGADHDYRRWTFPGVADRPVLLFDPRSTAQLRTTGTIAADELGVVAPATAELRISTSAGDETRAREVQQLPPMLGDWAGYRVAHLDLQDAAQLIVVGQDGQRNRFPVVRGRDRPALEGPLADGVKTSDEATVYRSVPVVCVPSLGTAVTWHLRVQRADTTVTREIRCDGGTIELHDLLPGDGFGAHRIRLTGPLGLDLTERFAVVPGLDIDRPHSAVMPGQAVNVSARAPDTAINAGVPGERVALDVETDAPRALVRATRGAQDLDLTVRIPRLLWTVLHESKPAVQPSSVLDRIGREEFDDHLADMLLVSLGRPGVDLALELRDASGTSLLVGSHTSSAGIDGRWLFNLGEFADLIRASEAGRLELHLHAGASRVHVADIVASIEVRRVTATARIADQFTEVVVRFEQDREVSGRIARLWSELRPWARPLQVPIEDGALEARFAGYDELPPGIYVAEIAIEDPWTTPQWPTGDAPNARRVRVGDRAQLVEFLDQLDPAAPVNLITWAMTGHYRDADLDISDLARHGEELSAALASSLRDLAPDQASPEAFRRVASLATAKDAILARTLEAAAEHHGATSSTTRLALRLLEQLDGNGRGLDDREATAMWRIAPIVAAAVELPRAPDDGDARDRCEAFLGWTPGDRLPEAAGAGVDQLFLAMEVEQLRDIRRGVGVVPQRLLDAETAQCATFDWLLSRGDAQADAPRNWYYEHRKVTRLPLTGADGQLACLEQYLKARMPPKGTEEWGAIPVVMLTAAAHVCWGTEHVQVARAALEEALPWAEPLVIHETLLATVIRTAFAAQPQD